MKLWYDLETYSTVELRTAGAYVYSLDCEVMLIAYAFDDGPVKVHDLTEDARLPADLVRALRDPSVTVGAHNTQFDRWVTKHSLGFDIPPERWEDTMVQAYVHSLPGALDLLCDLFKLTDEESKNKSGRELIQLFCKPRPVNHKLRRATRETHPAEWEKFKRYAGSDITSMRLLARRMPRWNLAVTRDDWVLDQKINDRGVAIDRELCRAALREATAGKNQLKGDIQDATLGVLESATQRDKFLGYLAEVYDFPLPDLKADTIERRLADPDIPEPVKELLRIRAQASLASVAKFKAADRSCTPAGRLHGAIAFSGAQRTGRRAGRIVQPQNMPRTEKRYKKLIEEVIAAIKAGSLTMIYDEPMAALRAVTRGIFTAGPGKKLVVPDYANVEGRGLAWAAGEAWKLRAFEAFDLGSGPDLYKLAYARSFGISPDDVMDGSDERQIGKVMELALGYGGGVGAFIAMALVYGIRLEDLAAQVLPRLAYDVHSRATAIWHWAVEKKRTLGLPMDVYVACEALKYLWRQAHPETVSWWKELELAFLRVIAEPDEVITVRCVEFSKVGSWVRIRLPSGRFLCYASASLTSSGSIRYRGINQYTKQWSWIKTHGGKIAENVIQAICGDLLSNGMQEAETFGYETVLTVHDELITEAPDTDEYSVEELSEIICRLPEWAFGFPLTASGYEAHRYRKE